MDIKSNNQSMLWYPFPDLLEKFYTAAELKAFGERYLYPLFPALEAQEKPRKADLTEAFLELQRDRNKLKALVQSFSKELFATLEILLWVDKAGLDEIETKLGFGIASLRGKSNSFRYQECPFELHPGFGLIAIGEFRGVYSRYSSEPCKSNVSR